MNKKFVQLFLILFLIFVFPFFSGAKNFNPNKIISDQNYTDSNSMSRQGIQQFLEKMGSGLAKIKLKVEGKIKRVADIFYEAAKKYRVSQKLLLVTAQKEQSAITSQELTQNQKDKLMGYCIYPGSPCANKYLGIFSQIDAAAWQFRQYFDHPEKYPFQENKTSKTSDGQIVTPKNKATAGLYNYTPYQGGEAGATIDDTGWGGNFLFWKIWSSWFGDPLKSFKSKKTVAKILVGAGIGGGPHIRVFSGRGEALATNFFAFHPAFRGGVYVAGGDVDGDKSGEIIVGAGKGGLPYIRIFDGNSKDKVLEFLAYDKKFKGGVRVATGDVDGDKVDEIIAGAGFGSEPVVKIFNQQGKEKFKPFLAYQKDFRGGIYLAAGDIDGDKQAEIIVGAGEGGGPQVKIFDKKGRLRRMFFAGDVESRFGVRVAAIDINRDGKSEILTSAGEGERPWVRFFSSSGKKLSDFFAFDRNFRGGVYVSSGDVNGDGKDEIVVAAGRGGGPQVRVFSYDGKNELANFFVFDQYFRGGVRVATIK